MSKLSENRIQNVQFEKMSTRKCNRTKLTVQGYKNLKKILTLNIIKGNDNYRARYQIGFQLVKRNSR